MRVPVSHHARVSVGVCPHARGEGGCANVTPVGDGAREGAAVVVYRCPECGLRLPWGGPFDLTCFLAHLAAHEAARVVAEAEWGAD
jgi:hypothetical protein